MHTKEEQLKRVEFLNSRISELKAEIAEFELPENKRNYKFYVKGAELYRTLASLKVELAIGRGILNKEEA